MKYLINIIIHILLVYLTICYLSPGHIKGILENEKAKFVNHDTQKKGFSCYETLEELISTICPKEKEKIIKDLENQYDLKFTERLPQIETPNRNKILKNNIAKEKKDIDKLIQELIDHPNTNSFNTNYFALAFKTIPYENPADHYLLIENYKGRVHLYQSYQKLYKLNKSLKFQKSFSIEQFRLQLYELVSDETKEAAISLFCYPSSRSSSNPCELVIDSFKENSFPVIIFSSLSNCS